MSSTSAPPPAPSPPALPPALPPLQPGESHTELLNMLSLRPYRASDPYLCRVRALGAAKVAEIARIGDMAERMRAYDAFLDLRKGERGASYIERGFLCEYGFNVSIGDDVFVGPNCAFLDVAKIHIGDRTMIGASTSLYTPSHPLSPEARDGLRGAEWALPIAIGADCWLGGSVVVCPGVTIGDGVTVGAGSVVTRDVPDRCVVVGNPARVVKRILESGEVVAA
ncbi:hypothetical protein Q5752_005855 [Cryptotrichosporon argae]